MTWRGVFTGILALVALQALVGRRDSAERVGEGFEWLSTLASAALDPSKPAIPDLAGVGPALNDGDSGGDSGGGGGGGGSW
ncbi:hypothetical protein [Nocardioides soli]|uniref:Uncharacterized protein n=1 Tax=Nocardioides soli TaxID=1036020 RepID=A0A7W4Z2E5_9ACTN|nr:hypothetical protein [Nocardioides soli]MBB3043923.1 hypothetical protein [Nocardioides soli]